MKYCKNPMTRLSYISPSPSASSRPKMSDLMEKSSVILDAALDIVLQKVYSIPKKSTICRQKKIAIQFNANVNPTIIHRIMGS
jgi:hypothetical protein